MDPSALQLVLAGMAAAGAVISVFVSLVTKNAITDLELRLEQQQQARCKECGKEFMRRAECRLICGAEGGAD